MENEKREARSDKREGEMLIEPVFPRSRFLPWLGVAVLAVSWLPGLGYFLPGSGAGWMVLVAVGVLLLGGVWGCGEDPAAEAASPGVVLAAVVLMLPILWFVPWSYKVAPLLMIVGASVLALEPPKRWVRNLAGGVLAGGVVLLGQSLAVMGYEAFTARSHELPMWVARILGAEGRLLGGDVAVAANTPAGGGGVDIALRTMRKIHHLGATWELLVDPVTVGFVAGALSLILLRIWTAREKAQRVRGVWSALVLAVCVLLWLPVRAGVLMALVLHRALRTDFDAPLRVMDQFYSPWMLMLLVLPLVVLGWRFVGMGNEDGADDSAGTGKPRNEFNGILGAKWTVLSPVLAALAVGALTVAVVYDPIGDRKKNRVIVDEYHTRWEPTQNPYDTKVYGHESGYNYAAIYDYSSRFYDVARLMGPGVLDGRTPRSTDPIKLNENLLNTPATTQPTTQPLPDPNLSAITKDLLDKCDVFILKTPTARLHADEVECLRKFVADGGGLLLIGEHTDVFGLGTNLNDVARNFGFQFRYDILFNIDEEHPFDYLYLKPLVPHPIVQRMPPLDFEGPCTIEPTWGSGHAVMLAVGQHGEPAHYFASNFMPPPEDRADSRYGAWVLLWSTKYGKGRVVAHADSTQWSNFSAFEAGKPESWMGMVEWLNHSNGAVANPRRGLVILGIVLLVGAVGGQWICGWVKSRRRGMAEGKAGGTPAPQFSWLVMIAAGMCGFVVAGASVRGIHSAGMPVPARKANVEMVNIGIDRAISEGVVSKGGFIGGLANGYGIFERWILRMGWFIERGGTELFEGDKRKDMVVYFLPGKDVSDEYRRNLVKYVESGGRVLVIDTPQLTMDDKRHSTANSLLKPFGMELKQPYTPITGDIVSTLGLVTTQAPAIFEVSGVDEPLAMAGGRVVAGTLHFGKGSVTAIGFGARFSDNNFGVTGDVVPGEDLLKLYDMEYGLLRHLMGKPVHEGAATQPTTRAMAH